MDNEFYYPMKMTSNPLGRCICEKEKCACGGSWTVAAPSGGLQPSWIKSKRK